MDDIVNWARKVCDHVTTVCFHGNKAYTVATLMVSTCHFYSPEQLFIHSNCALVEVCHVVYCVSRPSTVYVGFSRSINCCFCIAALINDLFTGAELHVV